MGFLIWLFSATLAAALVGDGSLALTLDGMAPHWLWGSVLGLLFRFLVFPRFFLSWVKREKRKDKLVISGSFYGSACSGIFKILSFSHFGLAFCGIRHWGIPGQLLPWILSRRDIDLLVLLAILCNELGARTHLRSFRFPGITLLEFKAALNDTKNSLSNWQATDQSPCKWTGISCHPDERVRTMYLHQLSCLLCGWIRVLEFSLSKSNACFWILAFQKSSLQAIRRDYISQHWQAQQIAKTVSLM